LELQRCDPSGKNNRNAGMRVLIAASMAQRAAAVATSQNQSNK
jgi:hypothetical protein